MTLMTGLAPGMAGIARIANEEIEEWLRGFDGYEGLIVLTDEPGERARIITFWSSTEAEERSRRGRTSMREKVAETAGMAIADFELYDVPVCELLNVR